MKIEPKYEQAVRAATSHAELIDVLQHVIKLEHATLHPYLTALFSIKQGHNREVEQQVRWVAMEEMLHMCIVANLIVALGGSPIIDTAEMIPHFPGPLPMGVGDDLVVTLAAYSIEQVQNCFMGIEHPDDPIDIDTRVTPEVKSHATIGGFYRAVRAQLVKLGGPLPGDVANQVTALSPYHDDELFAIESMDDAVRAIDVIIRQGEGSSTQPDDPDGGMSHYYRFQELAIGRRLVKDPSADVGYSYTGDVIPFDPDGVWPIATDTRLDDLPDGSEARQAADAFARSYRRVLRGLHHTFNGHPDTMHDVVVMMRTMQTQAYQLVALPYPGREGVMVGPTFHWVED